MPADPVNDSTDELEVLLPAAFATAADGFPGPGPDLAGRVTARGRRMRRAQGARIGAAALSLGMIAAGASVLAAGHGGKDAPARPTAPSPVSAQRTIAVLKGLLPHDGTLTDPVGRSTAGYGLSRTPPGPLGRITYSKGGRTSTIAVTPAWRIPGMSAAQQEPECPKQKPSPWLECTVTTLPDGKLMVVKATMRWWAHSPHGQKWWWAVFVGHDGRQILVDEYGGGPEGSTTDEQIPLLTPEQLGAIATSPAWSPILHGVPTPHAMRPRPSATSAAPRGAAAGRPTSTL